MPEIIRKYKDKSKIFLKDKFAEDGSGWLMLQQIIIAPMSLATTVLLAKILSISDYGYYKYVLSIYSIISLTGFGGIYTITSLNIQRGQDYFFYIGFKYKKILRLIPSFIALCVSIYYFYNDNNFLGSIFLITVFAYLFIELFDFYLTAVNGRGKFKMGAILAMINYFVSYFPPIIVAYFTNSLVLVFVTLFSCQFLFRFFAFIYVKKKLKFNFPNKNILENKEEMKEYKKEIGLSSLNGALSSAGVSMSSALVFNRLGAEANAVYSLALTFADFVGGIVSSPLSKTYYLLSQMTKNKISDKEKIIYIKTLFKRYFWISLLAMIVCALALPFIYKILFVKYLFSYKYAVVYSLSILAISISPALIYFGEKRMYKFINIVQASTLIITLLALFFAATYFGVWGAIIVAIIMKFMSNLVYTININDSKR